MKQSVTFWISSAITLLIVTAICAYAAFRSKDLLRGPVITISSPENGSLLTENEVELIGNIQNAQAVSLNGRKIFLDESGNFKEKLLLPDGYTIITLKAEDRYKRASEKKLELVVAK